MEAKTKAIIDILNYVDQKNFVFGNIAFSHDGEDKINIGTGLFFGKKNLVWPELTEKNKEFGEHLNTQECFSITKYLKHNEIEAFSLSFSKDKRELKLIPFDKNKKNNTTINYENNSGGITITRASFKGEYEPSYFSEYQAPEGHGENYAIDSFIKTLEYYDSFNKIVNDKYNNSEGYIYLIRIRDDIEGNFAALAYMYLMKPLDLKDMEIISLKLSYYFLDILKKKSEVESIKSASAAIMSRNMSHNLGSHYLYYTKNQLTLLADNFDEAGPEIRGAAKVLGYMQARMDYLATIVSGDKYPYGAVFFKGQIFDELTIDDFSKRHFHDEIDKNTGKNKKFKRTTNYLLQNLVLSENFTRGSVLDGQVSKLKDGTKCIRLQIMYNGSTFTGADGKEGEKDEKTKLSISKLCIALPGGVMSTHAFYNVIENLIRNSAKYHKNDFKDELVFTICINEVEADVKKKLPTRYEFILFDNKSNAFNPYSSEDNSPLVQRMNRELCNLKILTEKNELDKSNKGLKEMLFSILWMRAYTYEKSKHMSDILAEMDQLSEDEKMAKIRQHAFEYVAVDKNGIIKNSGDSLNLGIRFELPKYCMMENVYAEELNNNLIEKGLNNFTDILCVGSHYSKVASLKKQFTRIHEGIQANVNDEKAAVAILRGILELRFPEFNEYKLKMDTRAEKGFSKCEEQKHGIFFKTHAADLDVMNKFAYCEAISGENFTKTMLNLFNDGFNIWGNYKDDSYKYFALKIKEAALTRITLIDERLYNDMQTLDNKQNFLSLKNIRVLNLSNIAQDYKKGESETINVKTLFDGNDFRDQKDATHFLSIHLGMIEKIVKDESKWVKAFGMESKSTNDRVNLFMKLLKNTFKPEIGEVFISIHSGRGNFSPELDDSLKSYPFISISAIESTYANSKFLLAQLFYNTVYIGKGVTNAGE